MKMRTASMIGASFAYILLLLPLARVRAQARPAARSQVWRFRNACHSCYAGASCDASHSRDTGGSCHAGVAAEPATPAAPAAPAEPPRPRGTRSRLGLDALERRPARIARTCTFG